MKDLIILGNGMAGMTAALYAKRACLDFKIVGRDEYDFGQIGNAILVENYPCVENKSGFDLACQLHDQLINSGVEIEEQEVFEIKRDLMNGGYVVSYLDGTYDITKTIIYALGARPRELSCPIEPGIPIHYCALCDGNLYKNKTVAVIGGGDSAFTQAEYLSKICERVKIVMCDRNITANNDIKNRVFNIDNIEIIYDFNISLIHKFVPPNGKCFYGLMHEEIIEPVLADGIFVAIGMVPNIHCIRFDMKNNNGYIKTNENCETEYLGFYVAGDARDKELKQAITAAADGAIAVQSAIKYLNTRKQLTNVDFDRPFHPSS